MSIHGGAFARRPDNFPAGDARLAVLGAQVLSVDYSIVPDSHYPDAVEDCYSSLCWAVDELPIDSRRIVITGASAGGALAAALIARDRQGPDIKLQALIIPVLDDRCETPSMRQFEEAPLFGGRMARPMWDNYLARRRPAPYTGIRGSGTIQQPGRTATCLHPGRRPRPTERRIAHLRSASDGRRRTGVRKRPHHRQRGSTVFIRGQSRARITWRAIFFSDQGTAVSSDSGITTTLIAVPLLTRSMASEVRASGNRSVISLSKPRCSPCRRANSTVVP